ncbi:MAG: tetratricopeptide repeat protein [Desulfomonilaceae bacterium]
MIDPQDEAEAQTEMPELGLAHPTAVKEAAMKLMPVILLLLVSIFSAASSEAVPIRGGQDSHNSALQALQGGDVQTAVDLLSHAIKADPNNYRYYNDRGVAYKRTGDLEKALSDYTKALEIKPNYTHALNNRGMLYVLQGRPDKAIQDFEAALKLGELQGKLHTNLGIAHARQGDHKSAIKEFESAVSFQPLDYRSFLFMAESLEQLGEKEKALKMYQLALGLASDPATTETLEKRITTIEKGLSPSKPVPAVTVPNGRNIALNSPRQKPVSNQPAEKQPSRTREILPARPIHDAGPKQLGKSSAAEESGIESLDTLNGRARKIALEKFSPATAEIYRQGIQFWERSEIRKALIRFEDVLQLEKRNRNAHGIAWSSLETGRLYSKMGDHARAAALFEEALRLFSRLKAGDETILTLVELASNKKITGNKDKAAALYSKVIEEAASRGHYKLAKTITDLIEGRSPERVAKPATPPSEQRAVQQNAISDNQQKISPLNQAKVSQGNQPPPVVPKEKTVPAKEQPGQSPSNSKIGSMVNIGRGPMIWSESGKGGTPMRPVTGVKQKETYSRKTTQPSDIKPPQPSVVPGGKNAVAQNKAAQTESKSRSDNALSHEPGVPSPKALAAESRVHREKPALTEARKPKEKGSREDLAELKKLKETNDEGHMIIVLERLAEKYARQKEYKKALAGLTASLAFRQKLGMHKGEESVFRQSGLLKEQLGDKAGALEDLTRALAQSIANGASKTDRALVVRARKLAASIGLESDAALQAFRLLWKARMAGDNHGETEALYLIGRLYDEAERPAETLQYYERSSASMLADKARIYEKIGRTNQAEQSYNEALESFKKLDYSRYLNLLRKLRVPKTLSLQ